MSTEAFNKAYGEKMRPHYHKIIRGIEIEFKQTGDTIHIWKAIQWTETYKLAMPEWVANFFIEKTLSGEGVKFDGRSIKREQQGMRNFEIAEAVFKRCKSGLARDVAIEEVSDLIHLSIDRVNDIYTKELARINKAKKIERDTLVRCDEAYKKTKLKNKELRESLGLDI